MIPEATSETGQKRIAAVLERAVEEARSMDGGAPADYIPELRYADLEQVSTALTLTDGTTLAARDAARHSFTLQSSAEVVLLEGLGGEKVFRVVGSCLASRASNSSGEADSP